MENCRAVPLPSYLPCDFSMGKQDILHHTEGNIFHYQLDDIHFKDGNVNLQHNSDKHKIRLELMERIEYQSCRY